MQLEEFLKNSRYFSLGHLTTEALHPLTRNLSQEIEENLAKAIQTVQSIDLQAIANLQKSLPELTALKNHISSTLKNGGRIFLSGCGATGRLALGLEFMWRKTHAGSALENSVQGFMAGGDFALVKSVENFEDFPEYGERHLLDLGFGEKDLLIAITEGGETPYVIGTVWGALKQSKLDPWFVYCNPTDVLCATVERSREVIENSRVHALYLESGPMALSGSTRLQAATVQMLGVGAALLGDLNLIEKFHSEYASLKLDSFLVPAIEWESSVYQKNGTVLYQTNTYPIAVLTDTTERSPTFSLTPFEKSNDVSGIHSLCYLSIPDAETPLESWKAILNRAPIGLEWPELHGRLGFDSILEFDFGRAATAEREMRVAPLQQKVIRLEGEHAVGRLQFKTFEFSSEIFSPPLLQHALLEQVFVKVLMNIHSLMVMGHLHRFEGNVMTWVRPSNGKLIDRTARYLEFLLEKRGHAVPSREEIVRLIFAQLPSIQSDEAILLKILSDH
jgi:N-acetylmuramic acid 6-phosphate etherase